MHFRCRIDSVQSTAANCASGEATPMSKAEAVPRETAEVKISAGRKPGAVSMRPSTSFSAVGSTCKTKSRTASRTSLCPRVLSPGAQHKACAPSGRSGRWPRARQSSGPVANPAPRRSRTAATYASGSSALSRSASRAHSQPDDTDSSHNSEYAT